MSELVKLELRKQQLLRVKDKIEDEIKEVNLKIDQFIEEGSLSA